jgi:aquaporin Z
LNSGATHRRSTRPGRLHWAEWAAEFAGTGLLFGLGFSVVALVASPRSPAQVDSGVLRFLIIGATFGLLVAVITVSPLGRVSGAHMNPAVTLAFWFRGDVHRHDLAGFVAGQTLGALAGTGLFAWALGSWASSIDFARTDPSPVGSLGGVAIEAALTFALIATVFSLPASRRLARFTPAAVGVVLTLLIWVGSPPTGASLNPSRSLAPAVIGNNYGDLWVYFAGPALGAYAAVALAGATGVVPPAPRLIKENV